MRAPSIFASCLLVCLGAGASLASAQDGDAPPADPDAETPVEEAPVEGPPAEPEVDPAVFEEARQRFSQGVALARAGNCRGALAELNRSLSLLPRPNTVFNIAQCQEELHRYDLALEMYGRYLEMAPEDDPDRAQVQASMRMLGNLLGTIAVAANVEAEVWLDDRVVGSAPGDVLVPGGRHVIELRADGYLSEQREVEVAAGRSVAVEVTLRSAEENVTIENTTTVERPPLPPGVFFGGVALTVVAAGIGGYFGVSALLLREEEMNDRDPRLPPDVDGIAESALFADIFFVTAGVFAAGTLVVAFLTDWGDDDAPAEGEASARPVIGPGLVGVEGAF